MSTTRMRIAIVAGLTLAGLGVALWAGIGRPDSAQGQTPAQTAPSGITVTGNGSVNAVPDVAEFSFGVETQGPTSAGALQANSEAVAKVIAALKQAGVKDEDIQTQQVSVTPRYANDGQKIVGYTAVNTVNAKVRDVSTTGAVVEAAASAGANQVFGPTFTIADQSGLYGQALAKALEDARKKAQTISAAAGVALGPVVNIVEGGTTVPPMPIAAEAAKSDVPIELGRQEIAAALTVTFSIG